jgi:hypothetical protein
MTLMHDLSGRRSDRPASESLDEWSMRTQREEEEEEEEEASSSLSRHEGDGGEESFA